MEVARRPTGEQTDEMIERLVELINVQREDLQQTKDLVEMTKRDAERSEQEAKASRRDAKINIWFAWAALILTGGVGIVQIIQSALLN